MSEDLQKYGQLVRQARERKGLRQEDLGPMVQVHHTQISKIERGQPKKTLTPELVNLLNELLEIPDVVGVGALGYRLKLPNMPDDEAVALVAAFDAAPPGTQESIRKLLDLPLKDRSAPPELRVAEERQRFGA